MSRITITMILILAQAREHVVHHCSFMQFGLQNQETRMREPVVLLEAKKVKTSAHLLPENILSFLPIKKPENTCREIGQKKTLRQV